MIPSRKNIAHHELCLLIDFSCLLPNHFANCIKGNWKGSSIKSQEKTLVDISTGDRIRKAITRETHLYQQKSGIPLATMVQSVKIAILIFAVLAAVLTVSFSTFLPSILWKNLSAINACLINFRYQMQDQKLSSPNMQNMLNPLTPRNGGKANMAAAYATVAKCQWLNWPDPGVGGNRQQQWKPATWLDRMKC